MGIIYLTRGFETVVDDDLHEELDSYLWHASGPQGRPCRRLRAGPRKLIYMYHQILDVLPWVMSMEGYEIDHRDRNPLNNQISNLRIVNHKTNMRNTAKFGYRVGVCFDNRHRKYKAYLDRTDFPRINVGTYLTAEEAYAALEAKKHELGL